MRAKHFLFNVLTGHGHVTPTLQVAAELIRRGHRVDYATEADNAQRVAATGARWVPLPELPLFDQPPEVDADVLGMWLRHYFGALRASYAPLLEHCSAHRPDVLCYDATNWPGRLIADKLGIPSACTFPHLASNEHFSLAQWTTDAVGAGEDPMITVLGGECAAFSAEHGVALRPQENQDVPAPLSLAFYPREFQPHGETFDERFVFVGPQLGERERDEPWQPSDVDAPLLYVSLGSFFTDPAFYRTCIEAFGSTDWQVAMTISVIDPAELGPIPSNVDIRPRFPQPAVLRHARAFVSHAGMNSTMESLYYGVPLITVPQVPEQFANAHRISELGLGAQLDTAELRAGAQLDTAELRATVERVAADADVRARVAAMSTAAHAGGGTARAADELLAYAGVTDRETAPPDPPG